MTDAAAPPPSAPAAPSAPPSPSTPSGTSSPGPSSPSPNTPSSREPASSPESQRAEQTGAPPNEPGEQAAPKMHRIKIDGEIVEVSEEDLAAYRNYGLERAARKRLEEAAQLRKQLMERVQKSPHELYEELDPDAARASVRALIEQSPHAQAALAEYLEQQLELQQMSPEQRQLHEMQARIQQYEQERAAWEQQRQAAERAAATQQAQQHFTAQFSEALQSAGIEPTPEALGRMAALAQAALDSGAQIEPGALVQHMRAADDAYMRQRLAQVDPQALLEMLGKERVKKLLAVDPTLVPSAPHVPATSRNGAAPPQQRQRPLTTDELRDRLAEGYKSR